MTIWTVGYSAWPAEVRARRLIAALQAAGVTRLVDTRISPCASALAVGAPYGPREWNLQAPGNGIVPLLERAGIGYEWAVELGNPQKRDPAMTILRAHIADRAGGWPVHRGLVRLAEAVRTEGQAVALLCGCAQAESCHRTLIAKTLSELHFGGSLVVKNIAR